MAKRLISTVIGIAVLILVMALRNVVVFNIALTIVAIIGIHEFYSAFKNKEIKPVAIIGYIATLGLLFINQEYDKIKTILIMALPVILLLLFAKSVFSNMKTSFMDVLITLFGIIYIPFFLMFLTLTRQMDYGEYYVWLILGGAWVTDSFAYLIGSKIGKHKFSKISPNKSIEGAIAGIISCAIFYGIYTYYLNKAGLNLNYVEMIIVGTVISIISQIGDLAASEIKRFCGIKDFGKIMPGHGGILDRFDSIIMISPFVYMFLQFLN